MNITCLNTSCFATYKNELWIERRDRIFVKGYGVLSFAKYIGKSLSNKFDQKLFDSTKNYTTETIKTASKTTIQKAAEATGD